MHCRFRPTSATPSEIPRFADRADRQRAAPVELLARPEDLAFVHFTSGSTGPAKAVTATQGASALGALLLVANFQSWELALVAIASVPAVLVGGAKESRGINAAAAIREAFETSYAI